MSAAKILLMLTTVGWILGGILLLVFGIIISIFTAIIVGIPMAIIGGVALYAGLKCMGWLRGVREVRR